MNPNQEFEPAYLKLHKTGELKKRGEELWKMMESCSLCPRMCKINRIKGEIGFCNAPGTKLMISSYHPHFGEEDPLVGRYGSGTIFFTHCSLKCIFCQNWDISHEGNGSIISIKELADIMLRLQRLGCHNINFVTPDHYVAHIIFAIDNAAEKGLKLPIVYNTSGWVRLEILKILDGIIDIYLPDFKYWQEEMAIKYSHNAKNYPEITKNAILEMHRQVGVAKPASDGIIYRGLMIRLLVMPNNVSGTENIIEWIAENLPKDTYINIMSQYRPSYKAFEHYEISRRITNEEYKRVVQKAKKLGLTNIEIQGFVF